MFGKVNSMYLQGLDCMHVLVEADVSDGLPGYSFVGVLASEVREAQDRVRTAIRNLDISLLPKKVTINLSPADARKEGTGFDLPIAVAILKAYGFIRPDADENSVFIGELGLDGRVNGIPGILTLVSYARHYGYDRVFLPAENLKEAEIIEGVRLIGVKNLKELFDMLRGNIMIGEHIKITSEIKLSGMNRYGVDFSEINGQAVLRRAAEVAASGMHNMLMIGPAGSGKTMIAKRMPTILPELDLEESIEISKIYSICHLLSEEMPLIMTRPFRAPHHSISPQALVGGGSRPKPGEISLATGGILFLDEIGEMSRGTLECLRQPLEERQVTISRVQGSYSYPANFQMVAAMNPCRCGFYPDLSKCTCTAGEINRYLSKVSRPLLDRIDICVEAVAVTYEEITATRVNEDSATIRKRVESTRRIQAERFRNTDIKCNSEMNGKMVKKYCYINNEESRFMKEVFQNLHLSARMYDKILKVARTTADMDGREEIAHRDLCEAISYVKVREKYWNC